MFGALDKGPLIGGYLGLLLMGGGYLSIGIMASAWTRSQIVAFILSWGICFGLFLVGKLGALLPKSLAPILEFISLDTHFQNIARGVIDTRDLIYYATLTFGCLLAATYSLESRKWR
jgi:ABC-2 type transport system permease protein